MALAYSIVRKNALAHRVVVDITADAAYPAGGWPLSNTSMGVLSTPDAINAEVRTAQGFLPEWDQANNKLKMWKSAAGATAFTEAASADITTSVIIRADIQANPQSSVIV
jgi:hypothetical protein